MKVCYVILDTERTAEGEYIPCIVKEGQGGYYRTDWTWGTDKEIAKQCAKDKNERLGLTESEINDMVGKSMFVWGKTPTV